MTIQFAVWSPDEETFWQSWINAGIIEIDEDGKRQFTSEYPGIEVSDQTMQGWVPQRPTGATDEDGHPIMGPVPGWHCNVQVTGPLVDEMTYGLDQRDEDGNEKSVFDRTWATNIFALTYRDADPQTGFPSGYRNNTGVCYADSKDLSSASNVWL